MNRYWICIPVFNDWAAVTEVIRRIDVVASKIRAQFGIVLVDDASTDPAPSELDLTLSKIERIAVLGLRRNLGHQRAIAVGLSYIDQHQPFWGLIIMDGDGEDRPEDLPALIRHFEKNEGRMAIFAKRGRRTDGWLFFVSYQIYKVIHLVLTGRRVEVGNFSVLPKAHVESLTVTSDLWNHFAASVVRAQLPVETITLDRGIRIAGKSKMNFHLLTIHGLSAMAVYSDRIGVRLLAFTAALLATSLIALIAVLYTRFATEMAIPGWATTAAGSLCSIALLLCMIGLVLVFVVLNDRQHAGFLPVRDCPVFISRVSEIRGREL